MQEDWVKVYKDTDFYKSEIVRQVLIDHGIEAVLIDKRGFPYLIIGEAEVYIHQDNFQKAIEIIINSEL